MLRSKLVKESKLTMNDSFHILHEYEMLSRELKLAKPGLL